jgi:hypothetical protein
MPRPSVSEETTDRLKSVANDEMAVPVESVDFEDWLIVALDALEREQNRENRPTGGINTQTR